MTPFYDDGSCQVWHGDARALPLADESVHLIVTSPPYNARVNYDGYDDWLPWEDYWRGLIEPSLRECYRVLVHGGRIAVNIANVVRSDIQDYRWSSSRRADTERRKTLTRRHGDRWKPPGKGGEPWALMISPRMWALMESIGFLPREQLTWVKATSAQDIGTHSTPWGTWCSPANPVLRAVCEPVFIASKGTHAREPKPSDLTPQEFKAWTRNAWSIQTAGQTGYGQHPATYPPELPRRLIKLYSYVGDIVLDPFCGSGTTLRAAKDAGRRGVGVELSPRYCALSANRCRQDLLFAPGEVSA